MIRCIDRQTNAAYPCHDAYRFTGLCLRCGAVVAPRAHKEYVSRLRGDLAREETWEQEIGERTRKGCDLREQLAAEALRETDEE